MAKWVLKRKKADVETMAKALAISPVFSKILVNREINTRRKWKEFSSLSFSRSADIKNMKGVLEGFDIVAEAIQKGHKILVYGDYDADGVMSTSILLKALEALGGEVAYYIPGRIDEGYGLNLNALAKIHEAGYDLLILCDNGISAYKEIEKAKDLGLKVIIIDHHEPPVSIADNLEIIPSADAVIDPKQSDCPYEFKHMCAAGLCYRFVKGYYEHFNMSFSLDKELLIMAAIATLCDIVDLTGDNRIIVYNGLEALNKGEIPSNTPLTRNGFYVSLNL